MTKQLGKNKKDSSEEKIIEILIPLVPKEIIQAPPEGALIKKINFGATKIRSEDLIRLFFIDKNSNPIIYPVDSFELDTGWIETILGKEYSIFRREITFKENTTKDLINDTINFIRYNCNPGSSKECFGWISYVNEDNPMYYTIRTSKK